jgi:hypothetical protein
MIRNGEIEDAKTMVGVMLAVQRVAGGFNAETAEFAE